MATIEKTDAAHKEWLLKHMPKEFAVELTPEEISIVAHALVYSEQFEQYVHLNFKMSALVLSLDNETADEEILQHYGEKGIRGYRSYVTSANLAPYQLPIRITRVLFTSTQSENPIAMPEDSAPKLIEAAKKSDSVQYKIINPDGKRMLLCFAWRNVQKRFFVYRLAGACRRHGLKMTGLQFAYLNPLSIDCILVGMLELSNKAYGDARLLRMSSKATLDDKSNMLRFMREFELLKNFRGVDALRGLVEKSVITGNQANLLRAITALLEQLLSDVNAALYTEEAIMEAFCFHQELTIDFLNVFRAKFHPKKHDLAEYEKAKKALADKLATLDTGRKKHDDRRRMVFSQALNLAEHILRTNAYEYHKLGIGFRLNPAYLDKVPGFDRKAKFPDLPYSVYFVKGWNYFGMQVRFRDLARGGMRTVVAWDKEHEKYERSNMFTECYNLAFTQQKKNKDIPEGGSKAILFLSANEELPHELELARKELEASGMAASEIEKTLAKMKKEQQLEYMYYNQRCFLETFLTLFIWDFENNRLKYGEHVVDYLNIPEYLYLGPDENFHDYLIQWLAAKSTEMGYYAGGAFISGKEETGVNHKEYGVTSWGALQFLHQALKFVGLDGDFTVKLTGGPDGDVAGNFILLLHKYYPKRAKLLAITDGSGTLYDPQGLDYPTLEKMFHKVQACAEYPPELLHDGGWALKIHESRQATPLIKECLCVRKKDGKVVDDWISSNTAFKMYGTTAHTVVTDVFLPCGGRPRTLHMGNMQDFFTAEGKPTAKIIVEGANLYIPQDAREYLEDKGVILFRDSSANKCGVVSSSYEILSGLTLTDEQFKKVKPELAKNILERLEKIANDEAKCMLDYYVQMDRKVKLTKISDLVSELINRYTDDLATYLKPLNLTAPENKKLLDIFINYVPECVRREHLDRCLSRVPDMHKKAVIATHLACRFVYGRGLAWRPSIVDILPTVL